MDTDVSNDHGKNQARVHAHDTGANGKDKSNGGGNNKNPRVSPGNNAGDTNTVHERPGENSQEVSSTVRSKPTNIDTSKASTLSHATNSHKKSDEGSDCTDKPYEGGWSPLAWNAYGTQGTADNILNTPDAEPPSDSTKDEKLMWYLSFSGGPHVYNARDEKEQVKRGQDCSGGG
jgi:hypothetical protein